LPFHFHAISFVFKNIVIHQACNYTIFYPIFLIPSLLDKNTCMRISMS
jgi:hypothetical protein